MTSDSKTIDRLADKYDGMWETALGSSLVGLGGMALYSLMADCFAKYTPEEKMENEAPKSLDSEVRWGGRKMSIRNWALEPDVWLRGITAEMIFERLTMGRHPYSPEAALTTHVGFKAAEERLRRRKAFLSPAKAPKDLRREVKEVRRRYLARGAPPKSITALDLFDEGTGRGVEPVDLEKDTFFFREDVQRQRDHHYNLGVERGRRDEAKLLRRIVECDSEVSRLKLELQAAEASLAAERERTKFFGELKIAWEWFRVVASSRTPAFDEANPARRPFVIVADLLDRTLGFATAVASPAAPAAPAAPSTEAP